MRAANRESSRTATGRCETAKSKPVTLRLPGQARNAGATHGHCVWLISLSIACSRIIRIVTSVKMSFLLDWRISHVIFMPQQAHPLLSTFLFPKPTSPNAAHGPWRVVPGYVSVSGLRPLSPVYLPSPMWPFLLNHRATLLLCDTSWQHDA